MGCAIPNFITQALEGEEITVHGGGSQTRSIGHVSDLITGISKLMESTIATPVNIGNPEEVTIVELAKLVISIVRPSSGITLVPLPERRTGDPYQRCPDINRARSVLGWEPRVPLRDGVAAMAAYFLEHEDLG